MSRSSTWNLFLPLAFALVSVPTLSGCDPFAERAPDVANAQTFEAGGLSLDYPGNWKFETERETVETISVVSHTFEPKWGNSMVMVQVFTPGVPLEFDDLLDGFRTGMRESIAGALVEDRTIDGQPEVLVHHQMLGEQREGRRMRFSITLLGESTENTVDVYVAQLDGRTVITYTQAPDEDLATAKPAFEQILGSMKVEAVDN